MHSQEFIFFSSIIHAKKQNATLFYVFIWHTKHFDSSRLILIHSADGVLAKCYIIIMYSTSKHGGAVVQRVERWTSDQQVVGSNPTRGKSCVTTVGKLFTPMCLCHRAV